MKRFFSESVKSYTWRQWIFLAWRYQRMYHEGGSRLGSRAAISRWKKLRLPHGVATFIWANDLLCDFFRGRQSCQEKKIKSSLFMHNTLGSNSSISFLWCQRNVRLKGSTYSFFLLDTFTIFLFIEDEWNRIASNPVGCWYLHLYFLRFS